MAISLQNILRFAENSGQNPDGSPFDQRSLGYGDNPPLVLKDLPEVNKETNGALDLIGQVTDNFVRGGAIALVKSAVDDVVRLGKVLISPNGLVWLKIFLQILRQDQYFHLRVKWDLRDLFLLMLIVLHSKLGHLG